MTEDQKVTWSGLALGALWVAFVGGGLLVLKFLAC